MGVAAAIAPWAQWPSVEQSSETDARILMGGRPYRDIDSRCWSVGRRLTDMDAEGVALQVVAPVPVTFCHDAPADGAAVLARAQNDFLAGLVAQRPDRFRALGAVPLQDPGLAVAELRRCVRQLGFLVLQRHLADPVRDH
jgi:aminocarboxymuconate-semialdehyde decarboxylase